MMRLRLCCAPQLQWAAAGWARQLSTTNSSCYVSTPPLTGGAEWTGKQGVVERWPWANSPIQQARTPPSSWYTAHAVQQVEESRIFNRSWQMVGRVEQLANPGDFVTGSILRTSYVVVRGSDGSLRAFHNVCRHHASPVACGAGRTESFVCPYHGWTYSLEGKLIKATRLKDIEDFKAKDHGLVPIRTQTWGPWVFALLGSHTGLAADDAPGVDDWLGEGGRLLAAAGAHDALKFVRRRVYDVQCNWKVVVDNYLDGGYHVEFAHPALADGLEGSSYVSELYPNMSIQSARAAAEGDDGRLGDSQVTYAFVYPNIMINRYGPWMDTNVVVPIAPDRCRVEFDYFLDPTHPQASDGTWVNECLQKSHLVQMEDTALCEGVQRGLVSPAYDVGRYAPRLEACMLHFHQQLERELQRELPQEPGSCYEYTTH